MGELADEVEQAWEWRSRAEERSEGGLPEGRGFREGVTCRSEARERRKQEKR
jgi:hypothetical protein